MKVTHTLAVVSVVATMVLAAWSGRTQAVEVAVGTDYEKLFTAATFSLTEAIDKAMAVPEAKDCIVVNAEIEEEGGKIIYSIALAKGEKILEINFDVTNGSMLPLENEDQDKSAQAKAAKVTVKQAIETAMKKKGSKVIEASLNLVDGKPVWDIKLWTAKKVEKNVRFDGLTGEAIKLKKEDPKPDAAGGDKMAPYKTLADDAFKAFKAGDLAKTKKKAQELEKAWDTTGKSDLAKKQDLWKEIDTAMDAFIDPLMKEASPDAAKVEAAYKDFCAKLSKASAS